MTRICYRRHRFPPTIIQHAVWLYTRFALSLRDIEDLLAERGIDVTYETVRCWVAKFGPAIARRLRATRPKPHPQWHLDEMFVSVGGRRMYLWRAVDQNGEVLDVLLQPKRDKRAAVKLLRGLLKRQGMAPRTIVTDKLRSYAAAIKDLQLTATHHQGRWKNNRIDGSHVPVRQRERVMQRFRTAGSTQRFLSIHCTMRNHFNNRRHLITASENRLCRKMAFDVWRKACSAMV